MFEFVEIRNMSLFRTPPNFIHPMAFVSLSLCYQYNTRMWYASECLLCSFTSALLLDFLLTVCDLDSLLKASVWAITHPEISLNYCGRPCIFAFIFDSSGANCWFPSSSDKLMTSHLLGIIHLFLFAASVGSMHEFQVINFLSQWV